MRRAYAPGRFPYARFTVSPLPGNAVLVRADGSRCHCAGYESYDDWRSGRLCRRWEDSLRLHGERRRFYCPKEIGWRCLTGFSQPGLQRGMELVFFRPVECAAQARRLQRGHAFPVSGCPISRGSMSLAKDAAATNSRAVSVKTIIYGANNAIVAFYGRPSGQHSQWRECPPCAAKSNTTRTSTSPPVNQPPGCLCRCGPTDPVF